MSFNSLNFIFARGVSNCLATDATPAPHLYGSDEDSMSTIAAAGYFDALIPATPTANINAGINDNKLKVGDFIQVRDSSNETTFLQITQLTPTILTSQNAVDIPPGSIGTVQLADLAVTTPKLADSAVTIDKMATNSVGDTQLITNSVTTPKITDEAITEPKMANSSVSTRTIQINAITLDKLALETYELYVGIGGQFSGPWAAPISAVIAGARMGKLATIYIPNFTGTATTGAVATYSLTLPTTWFPPTDTYVPLSVVNNSVNQFGLVKIKSTGVIEITADAGAAAFTNTGTAGLSFAVSFSYLTV